MRFYPHNNKHRNGRDKNGWLGATATPAGDGTGSTTTTNASTTTPPADAQSNTAHALQRHQREFKIIFNLLEKILHPESTKRCTPQIALFHPMLAEPTTTAPSPPLSDAWAEKRGGKIRIGDDAYVPHAPGKGVCRDWHFRDDVTELEYAKILKRCLCLRDGSCVSEDGSEWVEDQEEMWCGRYVDQIVELSPGEGIAIGDRPCEFHEEDVYVYQHP